MSKYVETPVTTNQYQRSHRIVIDNPYQGIPSIRFEEEAIIIRPDGSVIHDTRVVQQPESGGGLSKQITDLAESFPVYDPRTQTRTGNMSTIQNAYVLIWSYYMHLALMRDGEVARKAVIAKFWEQDKIDRDASGEQISKLESDFAAQDAADLVSAQALAATKPTPEEQQAVMDSYNSSRAEKVNVLNAQIQAIKDAYDSGKTSGLAAAELAGQAAYDTIVNG